jgi:hypothetical protein
MEPAVIPFGAFGFTTLRRQKAGDILVQIAQIGDALSWLDYTGVTRTL